MKGKPYMISPKSLKEAATRRAKESGTTVEELNSEFDRRVEAQLKHNAKADNACLTLSEWERLFEGSLSAERYEHTLTCEFCKANLKRAEPTEDSIEIFHKFVSRAAHQAVSCLIIGDTNSPNSFKAPMIAAYDPRPVHQTGCFIIGGTDSPSSFKTPMIAACSHLPEEDLRHAGRLIFGALEVNTGALGESGSEKPTFVLGEVIGHKSENPEKVKFGRKRS